MSRHPPRPRRTTEIGEEIQCAKCKEFWPADDEFFFARPGGWRSWCKACCASDPKILASKARWLDRQRGAHG
ncbi:hypothetical protein H0A70_07805 [Alcaligenaceae bacterium]|nr:hypothetical protein [Alcaligenaceae bacterium]